MISIIVPVYNLEGYIDKTLECIINQIYKDIEVLVVDDGSTDNSLKILNEWACKDNRIKVFHQENAGAAAARNTALDNMTGEYVVFVDGDDLISKDFIELLYQDITSHGTDISICQYDNITEEQYNSFELEPVKPATIDKTYTTKQAIYKLLYQVEFDSQMWVKIYKSRLFADLRFPVGNVFEDFAIIYDVFFKAKKISYINHTGYYYLLRNTSTTLKGFSQKKMDLIDALDDIGSKILSKYKEDAFKRAVASRTVRGNFHIYLQIPRDKEYEDYRKRIENNIKANRKLVLSDKHSRFGTKAALLITYLGFGTFYRLKNLKNLGKH